MFNKYFLFLCGILVVLGGFSVQAIAQNDNLSGNSVISGTIRYEAYEKFDLSFFNGSDPKTNEWLASMPKGLKSSRILYFNGEQSSFEEDKSSNKQNLDNKAMIMVEKMAYIQPPSQKLKKIFHDHNIGRYQEQLEFMGRYFILEGDIKAFEWKPAPKQSQILEYVCMSATSEIGDKTITAWFSPAIQTWAGPAKFNGLPGLVLAVDIDGDNIYLATGIDLNPIDKSRIIKPDEGKKMDHADFDLMLMQKINEYEEMINNKNANKDVAREKK